jgi:hypothetical protein
MAQRPLIAQ